MKTDRPEHVASAKTDAIDRIRKAHSTFISKLQTAGSVVGIDAIVLESHVAYSKALAESGSQEAMKVAVESQRKYIEALSAAPEKVRSVVDDAYSAYLAELKDVWTQLDDMEPRVLAFLAKSAFSVAVHATHSRGSTIC